MTDWGENPRAAYLEAQQRIAELEHWFHDYQTPEMSMAAMMERIAELETERDKAFNKGMERAADMVEQKERERFDHVGNPMVKEFTPWWAMAIRKEIKK